MVLKHVVVLNADDYGEYTDKNTLHASNVRYQVEHCVTLPLNHFLIEVHFKGEVKLNTLIPGFIRH